MDHLKDVKDYWDSRSHGFSDAVIEELSSYRGGQWKQFFLDSLGEKPLDILDDGAGPGFFSIILASLGHNVTAIDYSEGMVQRILTNTSERGLCVQALRMDAQDLAFPDGSFDAVVQRDVLWNLDDPAKAISEAYRVLRRGGKYIVKDGNHYLSAHDDDYAREAEKRREEWKKKAEENSEGHAPGDHYAHNPENVDYTIIEKIALQQPLSHVRRPQWDVDQLIRCGFSSLEISLEGSPLPYAFTVVAVKPGKESI